MWKPFLVIRQIMDNATVGLGLGIYPTPKGNFIVAAVQQKKWRRDVWGEPADG
jgi:hypothetical protein